MSHTIQLYPTTFGPRVTDLLKTRLRMEIEGSCTGRYGYVVAVLEILDATQGTIIPGAGLAEFDVKYKAVVCKPLKGEVVEGVVGTVNKVSRAPKSLDPLLPGILYSSQQTHPLLSLLPFSLSFFRWGFMLM